MAKDMGREAEAEVLVIAQRVIGAAFQAVGAAMVL
jgi:hypothetical protein